MRAAAAQIGALQRDFAGSQQIPITVQNDGYADLAVMPTSWRDRLPRKGFRGW
jgi:hypothetical protein